MAGSFGSASADVTSTNVISSTMDAATHFRQFRVELLDFAPDRREVELALAVSKPLSRE